MAKSFKEFLGLPTVRVGGLDSMHPIADLGDTPPKGQGSRAPRATGLQAYYETIFNSRRKEVTNEKLVFKRIWS